MGVTFWQIYEKHGCGRPSNIWGTCEYFSSRNFTGSRAIAWQKSTQTSFHMFMASALLLSKRLVTTHCTPYVSAPIISTPWYEKIYILFVYICKRMQNPSKGWLFSSHDFWFYSLLSISFPEVESVTAIYFCTEWSLSSPNILQNIIGKEIYFTSPFTALFKSSRSISTKEKIKCTGQLHFLPLK